MTGYGEGTYGGGAYGGVELGAPLFPDQPGGPRLLVEIAFGADLTSDPATWVWLDVTPDVRMDPGIGTTLGRADEASVSQPASCSFVLDNATGAYSMGGQSPNYPNVRRGTPVRVTVVPVDAAPVVTFQGYANGFTPSWDALTGTIPVATVSASGVLRRLAQGDDPLRSALYRYHTADSAPDEYWPLEEEKVATQGASAVGGGAGLFSPLADGGLLYGKVEYGGDTDNPATSRAVQVSAGGELALPVRPALFSDYWAVTWSMRYTSGSGAFTEIYTDDPPVSGDPGVSYRGVWFSDGTVEISAVTGPFDSTLIFSWSNGEPFEWDDVWHSYAMIVDQTGASVVASMYRDGELVDLDVGSAIRSRPTSLTWTGVANPGGTEDPVTVAHVAAWSSAPDLVAVTAAADAHAGELATDRMVRLCAEESLALDVVGTTPSTMGAQFPLSLLVLLRECETVDQGVLYDGAGPGLHYVCRDERENGAVDLALDAVQLASPFGPTDDDQRTRNRVTATSGTGTRFAFEDAAGPLGTGVVGIYDSSIEVNAAVDAEVLNYASWAVHLGTVEGYRYPALSLDLRATPSLAAAVLDVEPSSRVTVGNMVAVLAGMPDEVVGLLVEGVDMELNSSGWRVTLKSSPYAPWRIAVVAEETGDTDPHLARLDTDGASLDGAHAASATALDVATPSGPLWTTLADDYPLSLSVGGIEVVATACTGAASPQTFTIEPLALARASGSPVAVWAPTALGL